MTDDYSKYPTSISTVKSERTGNAADWSPRDAIIDVLREIDSGKLDVDAVTVCYRVRTPGGNTSTRFRSSAPDIHVSIGLLEIIKLSMLGLDADG